MDRRLSYFISLVFFLIAMAWFSRGLEFPPFYHPDEINKVLQIQKNFRNFNHPQLMLNSAAVLYWAGGSPASTLKTAMITRWVSVFFAAAAVAMLANVAWLLAGTLAQICCGCLLLTTPKLFELAHYLKEDPALVAGFAAIYLTAVLYVRQPTVVRAVVLGAAAGLTVSAKYIGIFPALLAIGALLLAPPPPGERWRHLWYFLGACLLALAITNWQIFFQSSVFRHGLGREINLFEERQKSLFNPKIITALREEITLIAWLALAAWLASPYYRRKLNSAEWLILVATFGYAIMLTTSSRAASRYLLPIIVSLPLIISVGACWLGEWSAQRLKLRPQLVMAGLCGVVVIWFAAGNGPELRRLYAGFHSDTRLELAAFIRDHISPHAMIAEDQMVKLPNSKNSRLKVDGWNLPQKRYYEKTGEHLADTDTVADLKSKGVTHVVIFFDHAADETSASYDEEDKRLQSFIADLDKNGHLLWSSEAHTPVYINPPLRFYEIASPSGS